jgi:ABC-2 type transport system ATP-binding protein
MVELTDAAKRRVKSYSLGMRQRLALAAALLGEPRILILDEPANGLDPQGMRWLRDLLRGQAAAGHTVFVSSHVLSEIAQTADELVVIRDGKLVSQSSLAAFTTEAGARVRVRAAKLSELADGLKERGATVERDGEEAVLVGGIAAEAIGELALARGIAIHELAPQQSSLEERFLEVMGEEAAA